MNSERCAEGKRIEFIYKRDGRQAAIDFCKRTFAIYRECLMKSRKRGFSNPHHSTLPEYREKFIHSCVAFKSFLAACRRGNENES